MTVGALTIPTIGIAYIFFRLRLRREAFMALFTEPRVGGPYLASRGRRITPKPDESSEALSQRVRDACRELCLQEFKGEFGLIHFSLPLILASILTGLVVACLVGEGVGASLHSGIPRSVLFALLGGLIWSLFGIFRDYTRTDVRPATFYWIAFRYLLALSIGVMADKMFAPGVSDIGAFAVATLPFSDAIKFIRSKTQGAVEEDSRLKLTLIQGLDRESAERLEELGIRTIQQLAYGDPLRLLLGSNLPTKVLVDWMDQALLYVYLEDKFALLRSRGVRGAIDLATVYGQKDPDPLIKSFSEQLSIPPADFMYLIRCLHYEDQVITLWRLWGLDPDRPDAS
jgi:hypothetical protein